MKITVRLYRKGRLIKRTTVDRAKWRKVYAKLASAVAHKYCIKVDYGIFKNVWGKRTMFSNEGIYDTRKEARQALRAFMEL